MFGSWKSDSFVIGCGRLFSRKVWESSITSQQRGKERTTPIPTTETSESAASLDSGVGFTAGARAGALWEELHLYHPYLPHSMLLDGCCLILLQKSGDLFLENVNQEAECSLDDLSRQKERPKDTTNWVYNYESTLRPHAQVSADKKAPYTHPFRALHWPYKPLLFSMYNCWIQDVRGKPSI